MPRLDLSRSTVAAPAMAVLAGSVSALAGTLAVRILMARALAPAELGLVLLGIAVVSALGGVAGLGLATAAAERVARLRAGGDGEAARRCAASAVRLGLGSGAAMTALVVAAALLVPFPARFATLPETLLVLAPVVLALAVGVATLGAARGHGDTFGRAVLRDGGGGALRALAVGVAVLAGGGRLAVAAGFALGSVLAESLFVVYAARRGFLDTAEGIAADRGLSAMLPPFVVIEACSQLAAWMDVLLLGVFAPVAVVGVYGVARGLTKAPQLALASVAHSFLPQAAAFGSGPELARLYGRSKLLTYALVWPAVVAFLLLPEVVLQLLFGAAYAGGAGPLRILGIALALDWLAVGKDTTLVAGGWNSAVSRVTGAATLGGVAAGLGLMPSLGATGAALAILVMAGGRTLGLSVALARREPTPLLRHDLPMPVVAGVLAALAAAAGPASLLARLVGAGAAAAVGSGLAVGSLWRGRQPAPAR
ncbi:MAG TPA: oligosaccharide flippase family protein [Thermoanaerobaculaceae bacterium]|nr:oligosaccharide flippase family protein [Thermoanaerobaculaceae bacterium]HRS14742.1 oligosaccharide flippase family protein [Thermoanaerobaculaceae bacterium]